MRKFLLASAAAIAFAPCAAMAQDAGPDAEAPEKSAGLAEIIVTAQRREESAQRAAVAIDVVSGADIVAAGITRASDLSKLVPSLTIQSIGASNTSFIRGVGNFSVSITSDPAVAFNYDGVYVGRQNATSSTFYDLERIEVLKGPQGTLYGRNATAGVINILPVQPRPGEFSGYATASYGNYNALAVEGAVNVGLGENAAFRLSGTITDRDGYLTDGTSDSKTHGLRAQFKAEATPNFTIRIATDYTHLGGNGAGFTFLNTQVGNPVTQVYRITPTNLARNIGPNSPASQAFFTSLNAGAGAGIAGRKRDPFPDLFQDSDFYGANVVLDWDAGFGTFTIEPALRFDRIRNRGGAGGFPITADQRNSQFSLEGRLAGSAGLFDYTVGAFMFDENNRLRFGSVTFGSNLSLAAPIKQHIFSWAPFARLTANLTEDLRLVGGIRYTKDSKQLDSINPSIAVSCAPTFTCSGIVLPPNVTRLEDIPFAIPAAPGTIPGPTPNSRVTRSQVTINSRLKDSKATYRGAIEFDVAPASLLYASIETGYRSGGFNTLVGFETYDPEYITAYTLGSKNRFFDNRVQLNIEAFYWKYRNQQTSHPGLDLLNRPGSLTENIGRSTIKGIEIDGRFKVTPNTVLSGTLAYLDAKNKEFTFTLPVPLATNTTCAVTPSPVAMIPPRVVVNCAGKQSFNAPKWAINLAAEQTIPLGGYELVLAADTQYKTKRFMGFEYQTFQLQPSSWTSNAQVTFGPSDDRWSIAAYVRNIEDDRLLSAPFVFGGLGLAYTTAPQTYGVRGTVKF